MIDTLTTFQIENRIRSACPKFTYEATQRVAELLEQMEEDSGEAMEFYDQEVRDLVSQFPSAKALLEEYGMNYGFAPTCDEATARDLVDQMDWHIIIPLDDGSYLVDPCER